MLDPNPRSTDEWEVVPGSEARKVSEAFGQSRSAIELTTLDLLPSLAIEWRPVQKDRTGRGGFALSGVA